MINIQLHNVELANVVIHGSFNYYPGKDGTFCDTPQDPKVEPVEVKLTTKSGSLVKKPYPKDLWKEVALYIEKMFTDWDTLSSLFQEGSTLKVEKF